MSNKNYQRARQQYQRQTGNGRTLEIAVKNGTMYTTDGRLYVRVPGGFSNGTTTVRNAPFPMRVQPGINLVVQQSRKVVTGIGYDGREEVKGNHSEDLRQAGINPRQLNGNDPSARYKPISLLLDLQSFPTGGDSTVKVFPGIYRKSNGRFGIFQGEEDIEILSGNKPSVATDQVVVALWLNIDSNTITTTSSSTLSQSIDLKLNPATAITYINECAVSAPSNAIGIRSYIVGGDDTTISETNMFHDLRGILGAGASGATSLEPVTHNGEILFFNSDVVMIGAA